MTRSADRAARCLACAIVMVLSMAVLVTARQHGRLFPPEKLGTLEGPDRDAWQRPDQIMDALLLREGSVVADIGAGGGWFTIRLASRVGPNGLVYAEDVQPQMIESIKRRVSRAQLSNVRFVSGTTLDPKLPAPVDAVLMVEVYYEMEQPRVMLRNIARALRPDGLIGIVEYKKDGGWGPGPPMDERVDPSRVIADADAVGLRLVPRDTYLPYQYLLVFAKK